ncbi:hypothetical protein GPECTOR_141g693 [Gonium pectorale]|uniref:Nucleotide-diphospho-sugar transferase domain-containing protein n=1 Tax=Gonium pectorale TaxID=33097 RepID=A0A150FZ64_GONPE|nr:hypothetical protein GPECTOR_141g693 [Gonium pectorale]|eukprot:KXZ42495.1 hypothetical protein GPECTOR_141g693 [Gonium pectorale]
MLADDAAPCGPLSQELVWRHAVNGTVLVTVVDKLVWRIFGPSWVENVRAANISYWLVAALDPETSLALGAMGVADHCFNAPQDRLVYMGTESTYQWGGHHWAQTTWSKVHVIRAVYELGVHVVHSDADVVWFADPLPYLMAQLAVGGPGVPGSSSAAPHVLVATDLVTSRNRVGDTGLEAGINEFTNINAGIYMVRQWPGGLQFLGQWLSWQGREGVGHDQDGLNAHVRGFFFRSDPQQPRPAKPSKEPGAAQLQPHQRVLYAAHNHETAVGFLPASMFGNTYTYVNARLWEKLAHPLYAVHWVWGGSTMESKRQNMRDAMKFRDEPGYYTEPHLITFDLHQLPTPADFNSWYTTERMLGVHVAAANHQLQQAYWAFAAALITNRTLVLPRFLCHCSKNWYQTQSCRVNDEPYTAFPFVCSLSQLMRVKRLQQGLSLPGNTEYSGHRVHVREYSFLDNPKVPQDIKDSYLELVPAPGPRPPGLAPDQLVLRTEPADPAPGQSRGRNTGRTGRRLVVAAPLADWELRALLSREAYRGVRVLHLPQPGRTLSGFRTPGTQAQLDEEIQKRVAYWCCRSGLDVRRLNLTERVQLVALPPGRRQQLPALDARTSYLQP